MCLELIDSAGLAGQQGPPTWGPLVLGLWAHTALHGFYVSARDQTHVSTLSTFLTEPSPWP